MTVGDLSIIVAMDHSRLIGCSGRLPWDMPEDLRRFRRITMGHALIMGRKTWESLGRPLEGRRLVVMSRDPGYQLPSGVERAGSPEEALDRAGSADVFVAGGAEVYALFLPRVRRLYLTLVEGEHRGDAWFPEVAWEEWRLLQAECFPEAGAPELTFRCYLRKART